MNKQGLTEILQKIPHETWDTIVQMDPEWIYIGPLIKKYSFGSFAVLMVSIGLNSYQLKGKADERYWLVLKKHLDEYPKPNSKKELENILYQFYEKERLPKGKIKRLQRFYSSDLVEELWTSNPEYIEQRFQRIWENLADTMQQKKDAKTICFSMKCLGVSLLLTNHTDFDFTCIPIPVDSRVTNFSKKMNLIRNLTTQHIHQVWNDIFNSLSKTNPGLTMIHLDSLIWQIGNLPEEDLYSYFKKINLPYLADELIARKNNQ